MIEKTGFYSLWIKLIFQYLVRYLLLRIPIRGCNWSLNSFSHFSVYLYIFDIANRTNVLSLLEHESWLFQSIPYPVARIFRIIPWIVLPWNNICFHSEFSFFLFCFFFFFYLLKCYVMFEQNGIFHIRSLNFFVVHRNENSIYIYFASPSLFRFISFKQFHLT